MESVDQSAEIANLEHSLEKAKGELTKVKDEKIRLNKTVSDKDSELQKEKKKRKVYQRKVKELEKKYKELETRAASMPVGKVGGVALPPGE